MDVVVSGELAAAPPTLGAANQKETGLKSEGKEEVDELKTAKNNFDL